MSVLGILAIATIAQSSGGVQPHQLRPRPNSAPVVINEVCPDPAGADSLGREYIELVNVSDQVISTSGWQLRDAGAQVLYDFPSLFIPASEGPFKHHYIVLFFAPESPYLVDGSFGGDRNIHLFTGVSDALSNEQGCLYLTDGSGDVVDALIYGVSEPVGPGRDLVRSEGAWFGPRVNLSFSEGGVPISDGGSLGRDLKSNDYHKALDWDVDGGTNALGYTPGRANIAAAFEGPEDLIWGAQVMVNSALGLYSAYNDAYIQIVDASHAGDSVSDPDLAGGFSVTSTHAFTLWDEELGQNETLSGQLVASYERVSGSSFEFDVSGNLQGTRHTLTVNVSQEHSGFTTATRGFEGSFAFSLARDGSVYDYENDAAIVTSWISQDTQAITDIRNWTDWSGNAKTSHQRATKEVLADGLVKSTREIIRSFPFVPPSFDEVQQMEDFDILAFLEYEDQSSVSSTTRTTTLFDSYLVDDYDWAAPFVYPVTTHRVALAQPAQLIETQTSGDSLSGYGVFTASSSLSLAYMDSQGAVTSNRVYDTSWVNSYSLVPVAGQSKDVGQTDVSVSLDGQQFYSQSFYVDPMLDGELCGCGCGDTGCPCGAGGGSGGGDEEGGGPGTWGKRVLDMATYGACGIGLWGGPGTALAAGAGSVVVGWLYDDAGF